MTRAATLLAALLTLSSSLAAGCASRTVYVRDDRYQEPLPPPPQQVIVVHEHPDVIVVPAARVRHREVRASVGHRHYQQPGVVVVERSRRERAHEHERGHDSVVVVERGRGGHHGDPIDMGRGHSSAGGRDEHGQDNATAIGRDRDDAKPGKSKGKKDKDDGGKSDGAKGKPRSR